ncbi:unnamed protein product, partial [Dicrocoelium dendriticum]
MVSATRRSRSTVYLGPVIGTKDHSVPSQCTESLRRRRRRGTRLPSHFIRLTRIRAPRCFRCSRRNSH